MSCELVACEIILGCQLLDAELLACELLACEMREGGGEGRESLMGKTAVEPVADLKSRCGRIDGKPEETEAQECFASAHQWASTTLLSMSQKPAMPQMPTRTLPPLEGGLTENEQGI